MNRKTDPLEYPSLKDQAFSIALEVLVVSALGAAVVVFFFR